jgi:hypothetical protein
VPVPDILILLLGGVSATQQYGLHRPIDGLGNGLICPQRSVMPLLVV